MTLLLVPLMYVRILNDVKCTFGQQQMKDIEGYLGADELKCFLDVASALQHPHPVGGESQRRNHLNSGTVRRLRLVNFCN